ncbi:endonuclease domain-containing protein [Arthrobacter sp. FW306-07-I]|uniref:endonuclease domain-containing protein n=1 Tax=Arthrobacter sp. FW306-07-I TaxID=2879622 RepID=UPI001F34811A|nr:endonuclease domain-containing protein [Arthrobacter sp. FW306-07-I]UKA74300.1 endonuclease domain-containing protein [Arthrobacter sp. FW306-07-I]
MRSRPPLPEQLASSPFTLENSRNAGLHRNRLRGRDIQHISRGLYRPANWDFCLEDAARALSEATPGAWISHVTAARIRGSLLPAWLSDSNALHLSKSTALPGARRKGIHGHRVIVKPGEVEFVEGIWLSTRARTWLDMARQLPLNDLVAMGDQLVRTPRPELEGRKGAYSTVEDLRCLVARHPNLQGVVRARQALDLIRVGSDSAPETFLRLSMLDAGLPEPELQVGLRPGDARSPSADLGFRRRRVAIQYDGGHHLLEPQRLSDRRRDKAFGAAGWTVVIVDKADQEDDFAAAINKIKRALSSSTVDPSISSGFASK